MPLRNFVHNHRGLLVRVRHNHPQRLFQGPLDDSNAGLLVVVGGLHASRRLHAAHQRHAAAGNNSLLNRGASRVQGVLHARLLFLHFHFRGGADLDDRHPAGQLGHAFLQFFPVVVAGGFLNLAANGFHPRLDVALGAGAADDGGFLLANFHALRLAQMLHRRLFQRQADFLGNHAALGQDRNVLQHGLAAVAKAGGLHPRRPSPFRAGC